MSCDVGEELVFLKPTIVFSTRENYNASTSVQLSLDKSDLSHFGVSSLLSVYVEIDRRVGLVVLDPHPFECFAFICVKQKRRYKEETRARVS